MRFQVFVMCVSRLLAAYKMNPSSITFCFQSRHKTNSIFDQTNHYQTLPLYYVYLFYSTLDERYHRKHIRRCRRKKGKGEGHTRKFRAAAGGRHGTTLPMRSYRAGPARSRQARAADAKSSRSE